MSLGRTRFQAKKSSGEPPLPGDSGLPPCAFCHALPSLTAHLLQAPISSTCGNPSAFQSLARCLTPLSRTSSSSCRRRWPCAVCAALVGSTGVAKPLGGVRACNVDDKEQGYKEQGHKGAPWGDQAGELRPPLGCRRAEPWQASRGAPLAGNFPDFFFLTALVKKSITKADPGDFPPASPELLALFAGTLDPLRRNFRRQTPASPELWGPLRQNFSPRRNFGPSSPELCPCSPEL